MKKHDALNQILVMTLGLVLGVGVVVRTFLPNWILPEADVPNLVLVSLVCLLMEHYGKRWEKRNWIGLGLTALGSFGLLPLAAGFVSLKGAIRLAVVGSVVFVGCVWIFDSMTDRVATGPKARAAVLVNALGLYLGSQILMGMF